jgi:hypothetical protein
MIWPKRSPGRLLAAKRKQPAAAKPPSYVQYRHFH